jgi:hypothetical protein
MIRDDDLEDYSDKCNVERLTELRDAMRVNLKNLDDRLEFLKKMGNCEYLYVHVGTDRYDHYGGGVTAGVHVNRTVCVDDIEDQGERMKALLDSIWNVRPIYFEVFHKQAIFDAVDQLKVTYNIPENRIIYFIGDYTDTYVTREELAKYIINGGDHRNSRDAPFDWSWLESKVKRRY